MPEIRTTVVRGLRLVAFSVLVSLSIIRAGESEPPALVQADPAKLIELLDNGDFDQRQKAYKQLEALGESARQILEKALKADDNPDLKEHVERLLANLQRARLNIELVDTTGKPLPSIEFEFTVNSPDGGEQLNHQLKTDAKGSARLDGMRPGPIYFGSNFKSKDYQLAQHEFWSYMLNLASGDNYTRVVLTKGSAVKGRVVNEDGKPVPNASVVLQPDSGQMFDIQTTQIAFGQAPAPVASAQTDADGAFTLEDGNCGAFLLWVTHDEYNAGHSDTIRIHEGRPIELSAPIRITSKKSTCGTLKVQLLDKLGAPMRESSVRALVNRLEEPAKPVMQQRMAGMRGPPGITLTTDKEGFLEIKDCLPGKWQGRFFPDADTVILLKEVQVTVGQTALAGSLRPVACGKLSGRMCDAGGKGVQYMSVRAFLWDDPEHMRVLNETLQSGQAGVIDDEDNGEHLITTQEDGNFTFEHLVPGTYTLCGMDNAGIVGFQHGVKVKSGGITKSGTLFTNIAPGERDVIISGKVFLPDGTPATSARVMLIYTSGSSENQVGEDGSFTFGEGRTDGAPKRIMAYMNGYRAASVDLTQIKPDKPLNLTLEKQRYGRLSVKVTDPDGAPLSNAKIFSLTGRPGYYSPDNNAATSGTTDGAGKVVLKGLAAGKRAFSIKCSGYYMEKPTEVELHSDTTTNLEIKLERGAVLNGRVIPPPGIDVSRVLVYVAPIDNNPCEGNYNYCHRSCVVDSKGVFSVSGLRPGKYSVTPSYPGLVLVNNGIVDVKAQQNDFEFALAPTAGLRVSCGPEMHGSSISIAPIGEWRKAIENGNDVDRSHWGYAACDSKGDTEIYALRAGEYDLLVCPLDDSALPHEELVVSATLVYPGHQICAVPDGYKGMPALPPVNIARPKIFGSVSGRVTLKDKLALSPDETSLAQLDITLIGSGSFATVSLNLPGNFETVREPASSGTPPQAFALRRPGRFSIRDLPPGDYQMKMKWLYYNGSDNTNVDLPGRTVTVKAGEKLDLGEIKIDLPQEHLTNMRETHRRQYDWYLNNPGFGENGPDEEPLFRP
jgi:hypothetical protein